MKSLKAFILICLMSFAISTFAQNGFTIGKEAVPVAYNRMIFGQFIEHFHRQIYGGIFEPGSPLSDKDGFRTDVVEALKKLKIPVIRWPGGCFVSAYHWLDGVGPNRPRSFDKAWGVIEPNTFGTAEFVKWCRLINAEPYICTNAGTGTPEEMSDWVEYCNLTDGKFAQLRKSHGYESPFNVKYWSIGNENYLNGEIGYKSPAEWAPFVKESAKMMRAVDGSIVLFAAATPYEKEFTVPLLQHAGPWLNYISIHGYYGWQNSSYMDIIMQSERPEREVAATIDMIEQSKMRGKTKIAFDEWNPRGWHHPNYPAGSNPYGGGATGDERAKNIKEREKADLNSIYTMADAVFSACFLNTCLRNCEDVPISGFSPVVNTRGALFVHPKGIVKRTTFHVLSMYANLLEKNILYVKTESERLARGDKSVTAMDAILTCSDNKNSFAAAIINKHPEKALDFAPDFASTSSSAPKQVQATILSGSSPEDFNDIGAENRVVPVEKTLKVTNGKVNIPPHSVVILKWKK
jgi:alpha-N-arabinofuranosidase